MNPKHIEYLFIKKQTNKMNHPLKNSPIFNLVKDQENMDLELANFLEGKHEIETKKLVECAEKCQTLGLNDKAKELYSKSFELDHDYDYDFDMINLIFEELPQLCDRASCKYLEYCFNRPKLGKRKIMNHFAQVIKRGHVVCFQKYNLKVAKMVLGKTYKPYARLDDDPSKGKSPQIFLPEWDECFGFHDYKSEFQKIFWGTCLEFLKSTLIYHYTPTELLALVVGSGNMELIKFLVEDAGADVNYGNGLILMFSLFSDNMETFNYIRKRLDLVSRGGRDSIWNNVISIARILGSYKILMAINYPTRIARKMKDFVPIINSEDYPVFDKVDKSLGRNDQMVEIIVNCVNMNRRDLLIHLLKFKEFRSIDISGYGGSFHLSEDNLETFKVLDSVYDSPLRDLMSVDVDASPRVLDYMVNHPGFESDSRTLLFVSLLTSSDPHIIPYFFSVVGDMEIDEIKDPRYAILTGRPEVISMAICDKSPDKRLRAESLVPDEEYSNFREFFPMCKAFNTDHDELLGRCIIMSKIYAVKYLTMKYYGFNIWEILRNVNHIVDIHNFAEYMSPTRGRKYRESDVIKYMLILCHPKDIPPCEIELCDYLTLTEEKYFEEIKKNYYDTRKIRQRKKSGNKIIELGKDIVELENISKKSKPIKISGKSMPVIVVEYLLQMGRKFEIDDYYEEFPPGGEIDLELFDLFLEYGFHGQLKLDAGLRDTVFSEYPSLADAVVEGRIESDYRIPLPEDQFLPGTDIYIVKRIIDARLRSRQIGQIIKTKLAFKKIFKSMKHSPWLVTYCSIFHSYGFRISWFDFRKLISKSNTYPPKSMQAIDFILKTYYSSRINKDKNQILRLVEVANQEKGGWIVFEELKTSISRISQKNRLKSHGTFGEGDFRVSCYVLGLERFT